MADTSCAGILPNPDLAGIGTRFNLYATILLAALIPHRGYTTHLLDSLYMNAIVYGLAILITALVQTIQGQLDLYHAIIVAQMQVFIHIYGATRFILANRFSSKMKITFVVQALQLLIIFVPWSLYVLIKCSRFGAQPECNDLVKYVFFFVTVRATVGWLRIMFIICFAACMPGLVGLSMIAYKFHTEQSGAKSGSRKDHTDLERSAVGLGACKEDTGPEQSGAGSSALKDHTDSEQSGAASHKGHSSQVFWAFSILCAGYVVVTTELVVHRNRPHVQAGASEDYWGFGQIVSIILILPIVLEILFVFVKPKQPMKRESLWNWLLGHLKCRA